MRRSFLKLNSIIKPTKKYSIMVIVIQKHKIPYANSSMLKRFFLNVNRKSFMHKHLHVVSKKIFFLNIFTIVY